MAELEKITAVVKANVDNVGYLTKIATVDHTILSDEPIEDGGENKGMNPIEILASSLASCTVITLRMYINRKEWNITDINVEVKVKKKDGQYMFEKQISFSGASEVEKERLMVIADLCPVNKILSKSVDIKSRFQ